MAGLFSFQAVSSFPDQSFDELAHVPAKACPTHLMRERIESVSIPQERNTLSGMSETRKGARAVRTRARCAIAKTDGTPARSVMPEQREQNDDRQRHAEKPKKKSASQTHSEAPFQRRKASETLSTNVEAKLWFRARERVRRKPQTEVGTAAEQFRRLCDYVNAGGMIRQNQ
jgi:hypothetical protein